MKQETVKKLLRLVKDNYAAIAVDFDISRRKEIGSEIRRLAEEVGHGAKVLDAGCGNGRLLEALPDNIEYLGLDNSEALIALAKKKYPQKDFRIADILDLSDRPDNNYDYIFCLAVILHLPGRDLREQAVRNLAKKLKTGGRMIISVWDLYGYDKFRPLIRNTNWKKLLGWSPLDYGDIIFPWKNSRGETVSDRYYHAFRKKELAALAPAAGLATVKLYKKDGNYWLIMSK